MVQSDALSCRPDLCPEEDNDNEDVVMLPENVFIDLIDEGLQRRIAKANDLDKDVMDALQLLLTDPPISKTKELESSIEIGSAGHLEELESSIEIDSAGHLTK